MESHNQNESEDDELRPEYDLDKLILRRVGSNRRPLPYYPITFGAYKNYWAKRHESGSFINDVITRERRDGSKD